MREMKPLILPKLVAQRKSSKSSLVDMSVDPACSVYSSTDSGFCSASSDCSTPPTPSFYRGGHFRFPSSTSSLSSSPPSHDPIEVPNSSGKLPKLTEEPVEREYDVMSGPFCDPSHDEEPEDHMVASAYDFADFDSSSHTSKKRRSVQSTAHSVTDRLERKFPSLSRKMRDHKSVSSFGRTSRSATPSRVPSTRSSSITSSIHQTQSYELSEKFPPSSTPARTSREQLAESIASSPIDIAKANALSVDTDEVDSERFATTPLLPPMLVKTRLDDVPTQSPLQSPTVAMADSMHSLVTTPVESPPARAYATPPLSTKASIASFKASRSPLVSSTEIPPIMLADTDDKWALTLGHNDFTIHPEPYVPEVCDSASLKQLFADWEQARRNFIKHQVRMAEHNGPTSKVYMLCEEKWAEIDAQWKKNNDIAISHASAIGEEPEPTSPLEPAPLSKMPTINDPKSEGKFPKLGDEDIVGPMVQIASPIFQGTPPRKRAFLKFLTDLKSGSFLGRSSVGVRGH